MRIQLLILTIFFLFFGVRSAFADEPPILTSPDNNSTVTTTTLNWQTPPYTLYSSNSYRVQVDDDSLFGSINKDYYTANTHYSPQLSTGTWFWRVKAKNAGANWSNWSDVWSFILADATPTPTPSSTPTENPTPSPSSTPSTSSFTISNIPSQINSDESFIVSINLSLPQKVDTSFYIKGAFKKADSSNYFGLTKVSGDFVKNSSSSSNQYPIKTDSSGNWSGTLEIKVDSEDSGYLGSGDYTFKVAKYEDSNLTWSNEETIHINNIENSQSSLSNNQTASAKPIANSSPTTSTVLSKSSISQSKSSIKVASVAGVSKAATPSSSPVSSSSANIKVADQKRINPFIILGSLFVIIGLGTLGFIVYKRR